jgi:adenylate cyclase
MQLTAGQRYEARIVVRAMSVSVVLGAAFGHFYSQNNSIWSYIHGAVAGILISTTILLLEFVVFSRTLSALVRRVPFVLYLALRSLAYLVAILMGLAASAWLLRASPESEPLIERGGVIFSLVMSLGFNLLYGVNSLLGQDVLFNFVAGRYRRPRIEERMLLFIDMESSTAVAERLGETGFLDFLNRFVADVTESIVAQRGTIHKYVGDEIIVTWPLADGLRDGRCVRACFDALARLDERANAYIRDFGLRANFRAALHCGPVVIGELGIVKMEIALLGDTMNTAARLQQACRDTGQRVLASAALVDRLASLPPGIAKRSVGRLRLRGKENEIEIYVLTAAESATRAGAKVTAPSSRAGRSNSPLWRRIRAISLTESESRTPGANRLL